jgi:hypothetical protein
MIITETYKKNSEILKNIIKNNIGLDEDSLQRVFSYIDNPLLMLNKHTVSLLESDNVVDFRIPVSLQDNFLVNSKEIEILQDVLSSTLKAIEKEEIVLLTRKDVMNKSFTVGSQKRKIWKFLCSTAEEVGYNFEKNIGMYIPNKSYEEHSLLVSFASKKYWYITRFIDGMLSFTDKPEHINILSRFESFFVSDVFKKSFKESGLIAKKLKELYRFSAEILGSKGIKENPYSSFLSFNFFDWFLASTGESWSSCLSLSKNCFYGVGILSTFVCPDWGMLMVSKQKEEKNFYGITAPKVVARTWVIFGKNEKYNMANWYPLKFSVKCENGKNAVKENIPIDFLNHKEEVQSYSEFSPIVLKNGVIPFIFCDNSDVEITENNKVQFILRDNCDKGIPSISLDKNTGKIFLRKDFHEFKNICLQMEESDLESLSHSIENNSSITDKKYVQPEKTYCTSCLKKFDIKDVTLVEKYGRVCKNCLQTEEFVNIDGKWRFIEDVTDFEKASWQTELKVCNICNEKVLYKNMLYVEGVGLACIDCINKAYEAEQKKSQD